MPGVLQSMQLQRIRHALAIEQQKCMCMCQECPLYMIPSLLTWHILEATTLVLTQSSERGNTRVACALNEVLSFTL